MAALTHERQREQKQASCLQFTLQAGSKAFKGGAACLELASNKVVPAASGVGLVWLGMFAETIDATAGAALVNIDLGREVVLEWVENDGTAKVENLLRPCYWSDDHTVTAAPASASIAGLVWAVDPRKGVAIERVPSILDHMVQPGAALTYASNDAAPTSLTSGASYDVPTTAANSTITLPAAAKDGTWAVFTADGTKNGHTVTYRDGTGPTALTTALTASKRHLVHVLKTGGKWFALAHVSP